MRKPGPVVFVPEVARAQDRPACILYLQHVEAGRAHRFARVIEQPRPCRRIVATDSEPETRVVRQLRRDPREPLADPPRRALESRTQRPPGCGPPPRLLPLDQSAHFLPDADGEHAVGNEDRGQEDEEGAGAEAHARRKLP